ncbi:unnamed protein product, partial [Amoebophrya sp. A25]
ARGTTSVEDEIDLHAGRSLTASVFSKSDMRRYYSVGKGTVFEDWTWVDFRELEPSLVASYSRYVEHLKQILTDKRKNQEALLLESACDFENSPALSNLTGAARAAEVDKMRRREQDRKAAYGTLDEPPDELVECGEYAVLWMQQAMMLHAKTRDAITHCRFLLSYLAVAQMG